jgi:hypothetical protein
VSPAGTTDVGLMRVRKRSAAPPSSQRQCRAAEAHKNGPNTLRVSNLRDTQYLNGWRSSDRDAVAANGEGVAALPISRREHDISQLPTRTRALRQKRSLVEFPPHSIEAPCFATVGLAFTQRLQRVEYSRDVDRLLKQSARMCVI